MERKMVLMKLSVPAVETLHREESCVTEGEGGRRGTGIREVTEIYITVCKIK